MAPSLVSRPAILAMACSLVAGAAAPVSAQAPFPFTIQGSEFQRAGRPVFLHMIGYQPLEPGQSVTGEIRSARVLDDLRRLRAFRGGSEPLALRVYAQPTAAFPQRMPKAFYDGLRDLDFWVVRDIYFDPNFLAGDAIAKGHAAIDAVIAEVEAAGALDRIFAWELGNEFQASGGSMAVLQNFLTDMTGYIKSRMAEPGRATFSDWVTWASWPPSDPLRTGGNPISVPALDYASFNAYSYDPERMRDQQSGNTTGTPYQGYLNAIKARVPDKPVVVAESGLPDSSAAVGTDQSRIPPLAPSYRRGALTPEQVAEGVVDRYWDARLSGSVAGFSLFEWSDEWWKTGDPASQANDPEEHFGLARFVTAPATQLRFKPLQDAIRELYTMTLPSPTPLIASLTADSLSLSPAGTTTLHAAISPLARQPVRFRWEASRGRVAGSSGQVQYSAGGAALGPATVTVVAIDALGRASRAAVTIAIQPGTPTVQVLTFGTTRSSGRVTNVDLTQNKVVLYIQTNQYYVQPYTDMKSIWVRNDGYWWSTTFLGSSTARLHAWVVPNSYDPPNTLAAPPAGIIASGFLDTPVNDTDNDLLPTAFEPAPGQDRYSDPDADGAVNLEELLYGTNPAAADNDSDADSLADHWERLYFGTLAYDGTDDPDGDGLDHATELGLQIHPARASLDADRDGLPDAWERRRFGNLAHGPLETDRRGIANADAVELGIARETIVHDISADGKSELFWRNPSTGETSIWFMNGTVFSSAIRSTTVPVSWTPAVSGDFDGDGRGDLLWRNATTGETSFWEGWNGSAFAVQVRGLTIPPAWVPLGSGDFDGDGTADLFWRNGTTGETSIWFLQGTAYWSAIRSVTLPGPWEPMAFGDFDGDGRCDIFWRNTSTGGLLTWLMAGVRVAEATPSLAAPPNSIPWGAGDFNGDGRSDIFWRNGSTGQTLIWFLDGAAVTGTQATTTVPTSWAPSRLGDFDADGKTDLLWHNGTTGETSFWTGWNGTAFATQVRGLTVPVPWVPVRWR